MSLQQKRKKIEYECNFCRKTRVLYILPSLHKNVDDKGYIEYVDVHQCRNELITANILYVDSSLTVRSQVPVDVGDDLSSKQINSLNIPSPKKVGFQKCEITPMKDFRRKNLKGIFIKDKLRQCDFSLKKKGDGREINIISELKFIEIKAVVAKSVDVDIATEWFKQIASILEAIVLLDNEMLAFLITYLDPKLPSLTSGDTIIEIDYILHAKSSFPKSTLKSFAIFRRQWKKISEEVESKDFSIYEKLITYCIGNQHKTLLDIFEKAEENMSFVDFVTAMQQLSMLGMLNIRKVEFFTVKEV